MWIVAGHPTFYSWVEVYESYEEAKNYFDLIEAEGKEVVYLAEVKEYKKEEQ